jgi:uncharacterized protein (TIGR03437 family)
MRSKKTDSDFSISESLKRLLWRVAIGLGLTGSLFGQSTLTLASGAGSAGGTVTLNLSLASVTGSEPAAVEWTVGYPISAISSVNAVVGSSAAAAGKSLSCSTTSGSYICEVSGMNSNPIVNGVIASITFTLTPSASTTPITLTNGSFVLGSGTGLTVAQTGGTISVSGSVQSNLSSVACTPTSVVGGASSLCTVNLTAGAPGGGAIVSLSDNSTSVTVPGSVIIPAGSSSTTFTASTSAVTSNQSAVITASFGGLSQTTSLSVATPSITLLSIQCSPSTVTGGNPSSCTVVLSTPAPSGGVGVGLSTSSDIITIPGSVTVPAASASASFIVTTLAGFSTRPAPITATYNGLSQTANFTVSASSTILLSSIQCAPATVIGGVISTCTVVLTGAAPTAGAVVALTDNSTAVTVPSSITIAAGVSSATFAAATSAVASTQSVVITGSYSGGTQTGSLTVTSAVVTLSSILCSPGTVIGGVPSTCTVALSGAAPPTGAVVNLSDNNTSVTVPASVTIAAGTSSVTFTAATSAVVSTQSTVITGSYNGAIQTASLTVTSSGVMLSTIQCTPGTVTGGGSSTCTVALSGAAPSGGAVVSLSDNSTAATVPASATIPAGSSSTTFTATTSSVTSTQTVVITASYGGVSQTTSMAVTASELSITSVQCLPATVVGGNSSTCSVTLSGAAPAGGAAINLSDNSMVVTIPALVTVPAGSSSITFTASTSAVSATLSVAITATYVPPAPAVPLIKAAAGLATSQTASLTVSPLVISLAGLQCTPVVVFAGSSSTCTATLTAAGPAVGITVSIASSNSRLSVPTSISVPAGAISASFAAKALSRFSGSATVTATLQSSSVSAIITAGSKKTNQTISAAGTSSVAQFTVRPADETTVASTTPISTALSNIRALELSCLPKQAHGGESVTCDLQLSSADLPDGTDITVSASDPSVQVPALISSRSGQARLSFQAAISPQAQTHSASISVTLGAMSVQDQVVVLASPKPVLTVPGPQFAVFGSTLSFDVTASSGAGALVYLSSDKLPTGATFNRSSGRFIWTPKRSQQGSWSISFTATDQNHNAAPEEVNVEVGDGTPKIDRIVHSSSNSSATVCTAGSLAAIYGAWLSTDVASDPTGASLVLAGAKVSFDGKYVPIVYASPSELILVCPDLVAANIIVEASSGRSAPVQMQLQGTAPGIFTMDGSGTGQASASIEGGVLIAAPRNYLYAAQPAQPGDHLTIPVTGLNPNTSFITSAQIGDLYVPVDWIRPVAGWAGVMEVGVTLPAAVRTGVAVPLVLQQFGQDGRTMVVSKPVSITIEPVSR